MFWFRFAFRSCVRRRRKTIVTLLGMAFGVSALIVLGAIMVGVNDTMVENAVSLWAGHIVVEQGPLDMADAVSQANAWAVEAKSQPQVRDVLPRCLLPGILSNEHGNASSLPLQVWFVEPEAERRISPVPHSVIQGQYLQAADNGIVLGKAAASELGVQPGGQVTLTTSDDEYDVSVTGVFDTGVIVAARGMS